MQYLSLKKSKLGDDVKTWLVNSDCSVGGVIYFWKS